MDAIRRLVPMQGRDPSEPHRVASPLELLFDLAFVVTFRAASGPLAHGIADGHAAPAVLVFVFAVAAGCWAWINFSWFSSAYDTDDWAHRSTTLLQMVGVIVFALGVPDLFRSVEVGGGVDATLVVAGYVVMRVASSIQWIRVAVQDPPHRSTALAYAAWIVAVQWGWVAVGVLRPRPVWFFVLAAALMVIETIAPVRAERRTDGTPWHPHHLAERYGMLALIALGEGVFGTVAAVSAVVDHDGWTADAVLVVTAGVGLTFGLWWTYFSVSSGEALASQRGKAFVWSYVHVAVFGAIAATGAGLEVAALVVEGEAAIGVLGAVASIAVPVLVFIWSVPSLHLYVRNEVRPEPLALLAGGAVPVVVALLLAGAGVSLGLCLAVLTLAPVVAVIGQDVVWGEAR